MEEFCRHNLSFIVLCVVSPLTSSYFFLGLVSGKLGSELLEFRHGSGWAPAINTHIGCEIG